ncbi:MAG: LPS assembly lipoprotein LptE, partial [Planctomycetota bacterium]|nr:LPS assembly lipoprotein LptE [Planctomycetota bacterium]
MNANRALADESIDRRVSRRAAMRSFAASLFGALALPGCGYNVGSPFSQEVRSVAVSIPHSDSNRRFIENQVAEAVQKQIQQRSHFRIAHESDADTTLVLRFNNLQKGALGQTENSDARELQITLKVTAEWVDRRTGDVLR